MTKMIVMKPFMADSGMLKSGDVIDVSGFRNTRNLVNARYLRPVEDTLPESPAPGDAVPVMPPKPVAETSDGGVEVTAESAAPKRRTRKKNEAA